MEIWKEEEDCFFKAGTDDLKNLLNCYVKFENASIFCCWQGEAKIEINRQIHELKAGVQVVLFPGCIVSIIRVSNDFQIVFVDFSSIILKEVSVHVGTSFKYYFWENPVSSLSEEQKKEFLVQTNILKRIYVDKANRYRVQIAKNYIQSILLDMYDKQQRSFILTHPQGISRREEIFNRFIELVHKHCIEQREIPFYADKLCITARYLSTIVHSISGITAKNLIDEQVILESKVLLKSTNLSIKEVADILHFADPSFFGKYFKRYVGMTPLNFKNHF